MIYRISIFILIIIFPSCFLGSPHLVIDGQIYGSLDDDGIAYIQGSVLNIGSETAYGSVMTMEIIGRDSNRLIEKHDIQLGIIKPREAKPFKVRLNNCEFGDNIECKISFEWR